MNKCVICGTEFRDHAQLPHKFQRVMPDPNQDVLFDVTPKQPNLFDEAITELKEDLNAKLDEVLISLFGGKEALKLYAQDFVLEYEDMEIETCYDIDYRYHKFRVQQQIKLRPKTIEEHKLSKKVSDAQDSM